MIRFLVAPLAFALLMACDLPAQSERPHPEIKEYKFTKDWTTKFADLWMEHLSELIGKPNVRALEIGAWEGRSTLWMLENILTGEGSTIVALDAWEDREAYEARFDGNITVSDYDERVRKIKGYSQEQLPLLPPESFDLIYIDGCHETTCVYLDTVYSWRLLRPGGYMVWDDYGLSPKFVLPQFLKIFGEYLEVVYLPGRAQKPQQVIIRKKGRAHWTRAQRVGKKTSQD